MESEFNIFGCILMNSFKIQCDGYITKPYSKSMLAHTIRSLDFGEEAP